MTLSSTNTGAPSSLGTERKDDRCQRSAGATVKDQPDQVSTISRNGVKPQVTPERPASPEAGHHTVPPGGIEPPTHGLGNRCSSPLSYGGGHRLNHIVIAV